MRPSLTLTDNARVAVIGGGPAGSFFSNFLLALAERAGIELQVDIYESRDFSKPGASGCNVCRGSISESLVQTLATEGIRLGLALEKGAGPASACVEEIGWKDGWPWTRARGRNPETYHLLAVAVGVNSGTWKSFKIWE
jgi:hypothetical protein